MRGRRLATKRHKRHIEEKSEILCAFLWLIFFLASGSELFQRWEDLPLIKLDAFFLIRPDLMDIHVIETRVGVFLNFFQVGLWIGSADDIFRNVIFAYELGGGF